MNSKDELLISLSKKYEIDENLVNELMELVTTKYPPSNLTGNYQALVRDVMETINKSMPSKVV
ncbi:MAG TPA: hypothetical protein ENK52_06655 [Saprospiraceae bacterium]|nr:hypothetical protein [Saprospiraceae bacterium]